MSSRAREMLTFEALENSKHGSCHLASTKDLLLIILESRFTQLRGICSFQIRIENITDLLSQLSCSRHFRYLGLAWLGLLGLLGLAWVGMVSLGFKQDPQRAYNSRQTWNFRPAAERPFCRALPHNIKGTSTYIYIYIYIFLELSLYSIYTCI